MMAEDGKKYGIKVYFDENMSINNVTPWWDSKEMRDKALYSFMDRMNEGDTIVKLGKFAIVCRYVVVSECVEKRED